MKTLDNRIDESVLKNNLSAYNAEKEKDQSVETRLHFFTWADKSISVTFNGFVIAIFDNKQAANAAGFREWHSFVEDSALQMPW